MHAPLRLFLTIPLAIALLTGCKKQEAEVIAEEREAALPVEERVEPAKVVLEEKPAPAPANEFAAEAAAFEAWCKKFQLDANDPKMLEADNDGDSFPNREEFVAGTNPLDPESRPGVHATLRLKAYNEVRLPVVLESVDGDRAFLKQIEGDAKAQPIKAGESVRGLPYKVERVERRRDTDKAGNPIDISSVTLEDPATKERVVLIKDMPARTAATSAEITSLDGKTTIKVKEGEVFEWPGEPGAQFRVIDMSADQVVVQQIENKKMWTIPKQ